VSGQGLYAGLGRGPAGDLPRGGGAGVPRAHSMGLVLLLLIAGLFAGNVLLHYPGTMSNDAVNQYAEAISGKYTDWHPPVMAWLWSLLRHVGDGPGPMWLLNLALYWTGLGLLADATRRSGHPRIALLIALAGVFPPFVYLNATVMKDVAMAASWLTAVGLVFWFRSQQRRVPLAWGMVAGVLIVYGTLVRSNALFGLGPLLMYALAPGRWLRNSRLMVGALLIAVLAIPVTQQVNHWVFHPAQRDPMHSLFLFDLAGIAAHVRDPGLLEPRATLSASELKTCYTPFWWDSFSPWGRCGSLVHRPDTDHATQGQGLLPQWAGTIAAHPLAYASHRLKHFNSAIIFAVPLKHQRLAPEYRADDPAYRPFEIFSESNIRFDLVRKNPLFWPVTWLVWGAGLLVFLGRQPATASVLLGRTLTVSALGYSGAYLVIGVATDMRYHYWSMLAVVVATLVTLPLLAQGWRGRSASLLGALAAVGAVVAIGLATRLLDFRGWMF
jgi:hypothetical protein